MKARVLFSRYARVERPHFLIPDPDGLPVIVYAPETSGVRAGKVYEINSYAVSSVATVTAKEV